MTNQEAARILNSVLDGKGPIFRITGVRIDLIPEVAEAMNKGYLALRQRIGWTKHKKNQEKL